MNLNKDNDDKLLALASEIDADKIEAAVDDMVKKAAHLTHDKRRELADMWASEYEALCTITVNYLNFCEDDPKVNDNMRQAALNTYTQAMMYNLASDKLKNGLCEPTKIPL